MTYEEHGMWEILEVLKRIHNGETNRSVARNTGRDRETVKRYKAAAEDVGWVAGLHEPDEELAAEVMATLHPGPKGKQKSASEQLLSAHDAQIKEWLKVNEYYDSGLKLSKVHGLLSRIGVEVSYSGLYRYAVKHLGFGENKITVRMADVLPGEVAEVDFGRLGMIADAETGKQRLLHALLVTLVYSRHQYIYLTHSQKLKDLIAGLDEAWEFFGGVPLRVIVDNLKAAVIKPDRYEPVFNRTFSQYAKHHDFIIDAAVAKEPKNKPHVERQVPYVRDNFFRGETFLNLEHVQREALRWCIEIAGMRIHGTTRRQPFLEFESIEKSALKPANSERFDTPQWGTPKVHPDCHVQFNKALYSVPYRHRGKKSTVCGDSKLVRIYIDGVLVKTHPRLQPGHRSTDFTDYPVDKAPYAMRDADYIINLAKQRGEHIGIFAQRLLSGDFPWANIRQSQKLLRLCEKYSDKTLDTACGHALNFDLINVKRLENIIKNALDTKKNTTLSDCQKDADVIQLPLRFQRDNRCFNHAATEEQK